MSPPNKISSPPKYYYDTEQGLCHQPKELACYPEGGKSARNSPDQYVHLPAAYLSQLAAGGSGVPTHSLWQSNPLARTPMALFPAGCAFDSTPVRGDIKPISSIEPLTDEMTLNTDPITGKIRQAAISVSKEGKGAVAWSVSDFDNLDAHGAFALTSQGSELNNSQRISEVLGNIPRDTSVAVLPDGQSVVVFSQIQGDNAPSSLVAQLLDENGDPSGPALEVLPETTRSGFPQGQVVATREGFVVVFKDGEGNLALASFDQDGVEQDRQDLGSEPLNFQITSGAEDQWVLATLESDQVVLKTFQGSEASGAEATLSPRTIANSSDLSVAMQSDGSLMVAWNAVLDNGDAILEGAFLDGELNQEGENEILRSLVQGGGFDNEGHVNSHSITTDHQGNFLLAYEENRSLFAHVYRGSTRDDHTLADVATFSQDASGPYADLLSGLEDLRVQNVEVHVDASADGLLSFVFNKILSGVDGGTGDTVTAQKVIRRDYQINYE